MKQIILSDGQIALVDDVDFERLNKFKWHACKRKHTSYVQRHWYNPQSMKRTLKRMHREILGVIDPKIITDHIDHNGLNNQRCNLRSCTQSENRMNSRLRKNNVTGFKGVSTFKNRNHGMWKGFNGPIFRARIVFERKEIALGYFRTSKEAAVAYNLKAKELYGEFAVLNQV